MVALRVVREKMVASAGEYWVAAPQSTWQHLERAARWLMYGHELRTVGRIAEVLLVKMTLWHE